MKVGQFQKDINNRITSICNLCKILFHAGIICRKISNLQVQLISDAQVYLNYVKQNLLIN